MIQALWSASAGMLGQQLAIDNVANNLANVNTTGYKKSKVEFQDLLYSQMRAPGKETLRGDVIPTGYQIGNGVRLAGTQVLFGQGNIQQTGNPLDFAIEGNGFFTVQRPDGSLGYTRDGALKMDGTGTLVTSEGYPVLDDKLQPIVFDNPQSFNISGQGVILELQDTARLAGFTFAKEDKLEKVEDGIFRPTQDSGKAEAAEGTTGDAAKGLYFQVLMPDGKVAYTKETEVKLDANGRLLSAKGHPFVPEVYLENSGGNVSLDKDGNVTAAVEVGKLNMAKFTNPTGLERSGSNIYIETVNSGAAQAAAEGEFSLISSSLEGSNVDMAEEMVNMIMANRAYELSSRAIRTSDEMLGMANQLIRR